MGIWFKNRDVITKWVHFAAICKCFQPFGTFATERHSINQYVVQQVVKSLCKNILSITQPWMRYYVVWHEPYMEHRLKQSSMAPICFVCSSPNLRVISLQAHNEMQRLLWGANGPSLIYHQQCLVPIYTCENDVFVPAGTVLSRQVFQI